MKLEAKRMTAIVTAVSAIVIADETGNDDDIFIMLSHKYGILQNKARCRTSLTPRL